MNKIGKVLRVPGATEGLVSLEGQQHPFTLEAHWRSDDPPAIGTGVDAELTDDGQLVQLKRRDLAQEASDRAGQTVDWLKVNGGPMARSVVGTVGPLSLGASFLLYAAWHWMDFVTLKIMGQSNGLALVQLLPMLKGNSVEAMMSMSSGNTGFAGFLMWVALLAPLTIPWVKHRMGSLLALAPIAYLLFLYVSLQVLIGRMQDGVSEAGKMFGGNYARQMMNEVSQAFSFGLGAYLSLIVALAMGVIAVRGWQSRQHQAA